MPRPRKPTALRLLQGNPGKRPLPKNEPTAPVGAERPRARMTAGARAVWDELYPKLERSRIITDLDSAAFEHLCNLEANRRALIELKVEATKSGDTAIALKVMIEERKLSPQLAALYGKFGMTPSDRSKVTTTPDEPKSKLAGFLG